ncbi:uncharacterized protein LOC144711423 [Wolffia australiana]
MAMKGSLHAAAIECTALMGSPPVFIDTNIDTHIALPVSDLDTVADLKKKARIEHASCFPQIGDINILAMKVKRRSAYYHLSDAMLVKTSFEGIKGTWFLQMDVSVVSSDCKTDAFLEAGALPIADALGKSRSPTLQVSNRSISAGYLGDQMDIDRDDRHVSNIVDDQKNLDAENGVISDILNQDSRHSGEGELKRSYNESREKQKTDEVQNQNAVKEKTVTENISENFSSGAIDKPIEENHQKENTEAENICEDFSAGITEKTVRGNHQILSLHEESKTVEEPLIASTEDAQEKLFHCADAGQKEKIMSDEQLMENTTKFENRLKDRRRSKRIAKPHPPVDENIDIGTSKQVNSQMKGEPSLSYDMNPVAEETSGLGCTVVGLSDAPHSTDVMRSSLCRDELTKVPDSTENMRANAANVENSKKKKDKSRCRDKKSSNSKYHSCESEKIGLEENPPLASEIDSGKYSYQNGNGLVNGFGAFATKETGDEEHMTEIIDNYHSKQANSCCEGEKNPTYDKNACPKETDGHRCTVDELSRAPDSCGVIRSSLCGDEEIKIPNSTEDMQENAANAENSKRRKEKSRRRDKKSSNSKNHSRDSEKVGFEENHPLPSSIDSEKDSNNQNYETVTLSDAFASMQRGDEEHRAEIIENDPFKQVTSQSDREPTLSCDRNPVAEETSGLVRMVVGLSDVPDSTGVMRSNLCGDELIKIPDLSENMHVNSANVENLKKKKEKSRRRDKKSSDSKHHSYESEKVVLEENPPVATMVGSEYKKHDNGAINFFDAFASKERGDEKQRSEIEERKLEESNAMGCDLQPAKKKRKSHKRERRKEECEPSHVAQSGSLINAHNYKNVDPKMKNFKLSADLRAEYDQVGNHQPTDMDRTPVEDVNDETMDSKLKSSKLSADMGAPEHDPVVYHQSSEVGQTMTEDINDETIDSKAKSSKLCADLNYPGHDPVIYHQSAGVGRTLIKDIDAGSLTMNGNSSEEESSSISHFRVAVRRGSKRRAGGVLEGGSVVKL